MRVHSFSSMNDLKEDYANVTNQKQKENGARFLPP